MKRAPVILLVLSLIAPAQAAGAQSWRVLKTGNRAYAFDASAITRDPKSGIGEVSILAAESGSYFISSFSINCRKKLGMLVGLVKFDDSVESATLYHVQANSKGMLPLASTGDDMLKVAAKIMCYREMHLVPVDSEQAALDELKSLSN